MKLPKQTVVIQIRLTWVCTVYRQVYKIVTNVKKHFTFTTAGNKLHEVTVSVA